jgi:hypothetical protein
MSPTYKVMYRKRKKTPARSPASFEVPVYLATIAASHDRVMRQPINPITAKESVLFVHLFGEILELTEQLDSSNTVNKNSTNIVSSACDRHIESCQQ